MALWKLDGQEDVLYRNRCFTSLTKKFSIWWDDLKTSGRLFLMKILYMWTHSDIDFTVFGIRFTIVLLFEGRKVTCIVRRRMIGYCVCGQTVCECKRINCRYIHMYILISYIIAFVLYTFKETSLYGNACSGALL